MLETMKIKFSTQSKDLEATVLSLQDELNPARSDAANSPEMYCERRTKEFSTKIKDLEATVQNLQSKLTTATSKVNEVEAKLSVQTREFAEKSQEHRSSTC